MRAEKIAIIDEIKGHMERSGYALLVGYQGLNVAKMAALRSELRPMRARMDVVKNTYFGQAAKALGRPRLPPEVTALTTAMVTGEADVAQVVKVLARFARTNEALKLKGGFLGAQPLCAADLSELAALESRELLLARAVGTIAAPMMQLVGVMQQKVLSLLYVLKAVEEKKSKS
jgi:large subunit ribosomal protein L10